MHYFVASLPLHRPSSNNCCSTGPRPSATLPHKTQGQGDIHLMSQTLKHRQQCGLLAVTNEKLAAAARGAARNHETSIRNKQPHKTRRQTHHMLYCCHVNLQFFVASLPLRRTSSNNCCTTIPQRSATLPHKTHLSRQQCGLLTTMKGAHPHPRNKQPPQSRWQMHHIVSLTAAQPFHGHLQPSLRNTMAWRHPTHIFNLETASTVVVMVVVVIGSIVVVW